MKDLEGDWQVDRLGGFLPPMVGVRKRIRGDRGETRVGDLPGWPFQVERREERVALVYRPPFSAIVDELRREAKGSWLGRSTLGGRELGRFRMRRGRGPRSGCSDGVKATWEIRTKAKDARIR